MIKTALCISGHFRSIAKNITSINLNILSNKNLDVDIFIHTWSVIDRGHTKTIDQAFIKKEYNPKLIAVEPPKNLLITPLMREKNFNKRDINGLLCMFNKIYLCNELKSKYEKDNNFKYDCVIRYRADTDLHEPLKIDNSTNLNKLHIPEYGDYGGLNDQFAFSNSDNMNKYCSTYNNITKYLESGMTLNPEYFTKKTIDDNNLELERPRIDYSVVWSNGQSWNNLTRFEPQTMKKFGFVK